MLIAIFGCGLTATICNPALAAPPEQPIDIGSRLELLIDEHLIASKTDDVKLTLHQPVPREVAIVHDKPWEGNSSGYPTVFRDGLIYRMYYRGHRYIIDAKGLRSAQREVVCYAQSKDGIHWEKPNLGIVEWDGSTDNNIIWQGTGSSHNFAPFKDENPACAADAKYKAVGGTKRTGLLAFKSADGIHWSLIRDKPVFTKGAFDSLNAVFWDSHRKHYSLYLRYFSKGGFKGLRSIAVAHSADFLHWEDSKPLAYPGSPPQQMYTNGAVPYDRAPHVLMAFPTRYVAREMTEHARLLDPVPLRAKVTEAIPRGGSDLSDGVFMTSRDGVAFRRWNEAFLRPGPQGEGRWLYGDNYQCRGLVETKSAMPGGGTEISFYASEGAWRDERISQRRYSIRLDGFVSASAPYTGGEIITKPLRFSGKQLVMNYATSAAGGVRIEIQDATGKPIPGFALNDCLEHFGDRVDQPVAWKGGSNVEQLAGKPVRLRIVLSDADLYSFQFVK